MRFRIFLAGTAAVLTASGLSLPASAQAPAPAPAPQSQMPAAPTRIAPGQVRARIFMDQDVYSSDDVEIGEVEDLIFNAQMQVVLAVIEVESNLGFTDKYVAVPISQLTPSASGRERVTLALTRDQVKAMPGFKYED